MTVENEEQQPFGIFRLLYTLTTWAGTLLMVGVVVGLIATLIRTTSPGTSESQQLAIVRPTMTALAGSAVAVEQGAGSYELPTVCAACHAIEGTSAAGVTCPDLTNIATVAEERLASDDYTGDATTVEAYLRESLLQPSAYVVESPEGKVYLADGASVMPASAAEDLSERELEQLIEYMATLE